MRFNARFLRSMNLRTKLGLPLLVLPALVAVFIVLLEREVREQSLEELVDIAEMQLTSTGEGLIPLLLSNRLDLIWENLIAIEESNKNLRLVLDDASGNRIYPIAVSEQGTSPTPNGAVMRSVSRDLTLGQRRLARLQMTVNLEDPLSQMAGTFRVVMGAVLAVIVISMLLLAALFEWLVVRPLRHIASVADSVARHEFYSSFPRLGTDEMGSTLQSLQRMQFELQLHESERARRSEQLELIVAQRTAELTVAKNEAEAASIAKTNFLNTMSHELRTPLNAIMGLTQVAMNKPETAHLRENFELVIESSQRLLNIIANVLDVTAIDQQSVSDSDLFSPAELVGVLHRRTQAHAAEKSISIEPQIDENAQQIGIYSDKRRLQQVLTNLLDNAIKFTEHGRVTVSLTCLDRSAGRVLLRFSVDDTGEGIPEEARERIFEPFEQLSTGHNRQKGGSGLGLTVCQRIISAMGGKIGAAESDELGGNRFWFEIWAKEGAVSAAPVIKLVS